MTAHEERSGSTRDGNREWGLNAEADEIKW